MLSFFRIRIHIWVGETTIKWRYGDICRFKTIGCNSLCVVEVMEWRWSWYENEYKKRGGGERRKLFSARLLKFNRYHFNVARHHYYNQFLHGRDPVQAQVKIPYRSYLHSCRILYLSFDERVYMDIVSDSAKSYKYLLLHTKNNGYWKLLLEHEVFPNAIFELDSDML